MNIDKVVDILQTEFECVRRNDGENCDRNCMECDLLKESSEILEAYKTAIHGLEELQQYRQVGTVEERRTDRKRNTPIPAMINGGVYKCPSCGSGRSVKHRYNFCPKCGQAIDWSKMREGEVYG